MRHGARTVVIALAWAGVAIGVILLGLGIALRATGILGEVLVGVGALGVVYGGLTLLEAWWTGRSSR
jgi:hypothetical protein